LPFLHAIDCHYYAIAIIDAAIMILLAIRCASRDRLMPSHYYATPATIRWPPNRLAVSFHIFIDITPAADEATPLANIYCHLFQLMTAIIAGHFIACQLSTALLYYMLPHIDAIIDADITDAFHFDY
jgi:hypothetical protein